VAQVKGWVVSGEEALSLIGDYRIKLSNNCEIAVVDSAHLLPDALQAAVAGARRDRLQVRLIRLLRGGLHARNNRRVS
jgi:hypothetical protein